MSKTKISTIGKALYDMDHGPYNLCKDGKCTGCGGCCSNNLPLTNSEITIIKRYIKTHGIRRQYHTFNVMTEKPMADLTCPFMSNDSNDRCVIYEVRPEICKLYQCDREIFDGDIMKSLEFYGKRKLCNVTKTFYGEG